MQGTGDTEKMHDQKYANLWNYGIVLASPCRFARYPLQQVSGEVGKSGNAQKLTTTQGHLGFRVLGSGFRV